MPSGRTIGRDSVCFDNTAVNALACATAGKMASSHAHSQRSCKIHRRSWQKPDRQHLACQRLLCAHLRHTSASTSFQIADVCGFLPSLAPELAPSRKLTFVHQPRQGWGRGFESLRPLQISLRKPERCEKPPRGSISLLRRGVHMVSTVIWTHGRLAVASPSPVADTHTERLWG